MKILYLIRGCQGSGKSELAKAIVAAGLAEVFLETDMYFLDKDGKYQWNPKDVYINHKRCQDACEEAMKNNFSIVVSNTFTTDKECKPYRVLAKKYGYSLQEVVLKYPIADNTHGIDEDIVDKFQDRLMDSVQNEPWWPEEYF